MPDVGQLGNVLSVMFITKKYEQCKNGFLQ